LEQGTRDSRASGAGLGQPSSTRKDSQRKGRGYPQLSFCPCFTESQGDPQKKTRIESFQRKKKGVIFDRGGNWELRHIPTSMRRGRSACETSQGTRFYFLIQAAAVETELKFQRRPSRSAQKGETDHESDERTLKSSTCATLALSFLSVHAIPIKRGAAVLMPPQYNSGVRRVGTRLPKKYCT
jgi:hypothetical protein